MKTDKTSKNKRILSSSGFNIILGIIFMIIPLIVGLVWYKNPVTSEIYVMFGEDNSTEWKFEKQNDLLHPKTEWVITLDKPKSFYDCIDFSGRYNEIRKMYIMNSGGSDAHDIWVKLFMHNKFNSFCITDMNSSYGYDKDRKEYFLAIGSNGGINVPSRSIFLTNSMVLLQFPLIPREYVFSYYIGAKNINSAERTFKVKVETPNIPNCYIENAKGLEAARNHDYKLAEQHFLNAVTEDPLNSAFLYNLAETYWVMGERDKALEKMSNASEKSPDIPEILEKVAYYSASLNKKEQAKEAIKKTMNLYIDNLTTALYLVEICSLLNDPNTVIEMTQRFVAIYDNKSEKIKKKYEVISENDDCVIEYDEDKKAVIISDRKGGKASLSRIYLQRGVAFEKLGRYQEAEDAFTRSIEYENKMVDKSDFISYETEVEKKIKNYYGVAYLYRGNIRAKLRPHSAIDDYSEYIKRGRIPIAGYYYRALSYIAIGDLQSALKDIDTCLQVDPQDPNYYYEKGHIFELLGNDDSAIEYYSKAILFKKQPTNNNLYTTWDKEPLIQKLRTKYNVRIEEIDE